VVSKFVKFFPLVYKLCFECDHKWFVYFYPRRYKPKNFVIITHKNDTAWIDTFICEMLKHALPINKAAQKPELICV